MKSILSDNLSIIKYKKECQLSSELVDKSVIIDYARLLNSFQFNENIIIH